MSAQILVDNYSFKYSIESWKTRENKANSGPMSFGDYMKCESTKSR